MMHALDDITPFEWRSAHRMDLPALSELLDAVEYIDGVATPVTPAELGELMHHADGREDCALLVGFESGTPVGLAWLVGQDLRHVDGEPPRWRVRVVTELHPAYRHQQIGRRTLEWLVHSARTILVEQYHDQDAVMDLQMLVDERWQRRMAGLAELGLAEQRWFFDLHVDFDGPPAPVAPCPEGVEVVPFTADLADQVRQTHNAAFATRSLSRPIGPVAWFESLSRVDSRPEWSFVALAGDQVVGYALNSVVEWSADHAEGWTDRLGTLPEWRGRGIAACLLGASLNAFRAAGMVSGGLGVDSEVGSGGLGLYRSIGYQSSETIVQFGRSETVAEALQLL